jgi:hypothetical protein
MLTNQEDYRWARPRLVAQWCGSRGGWVTGILRCAMQASKWSMKQAMAEGSAFP